MHLAAAECRKGITVVNAAYLEYEELQNFLQSFSVVQISFLLLVTKLFFLYLIFSLLFSVREIGERGGGERKARGRDCIPSWWWPLERLPNIAKHIS